MGWVNRSYERAIGKRKHLQDKGQIVNLNIEATVSASDIIKDPTSQVSAGYYWIKELSSPCNIVDGHIQDIQNKIGKPGSLNIPNWHIGGVRYMLVEEIIEKSEVWLITQDDIDNNLPITVKNRFSGRSEDFQLGSLKKSTPKVNEKEWKKLIHQIRILEVIYKFLIAVLNYLLSQTGNQHSSRDSIIQTLQRLMQFTAQAPSLNKLVKRVFDIVEEHSLSNELTYIEYIRKLLTYLKYILGDINLNNENTSDHPSVESELRSLIDKLERILREKDPVTIDLPQARKKLWGNDKMSGDMLGCYVPSTGTIFLKIDSIFNCADSYTEYDNPRELLLKKVAFHEFIHAALDLSPRDDKGNVISPKKEWICDDYNEESVDNALVIEGFEVYNGKEPIFEFACEFIRNQPYYYYRGISLYNSGNLDDYIKSLIEYKISCGKNPVESIAPVAPPKLPRAKTSRSKKASRRGTITEIIRQWGILSGLYKMTQVDALRKYRIAFPPCLRGGLKSIAEIIFDVIPDTKYSNHYKEIIIGPHKFYVNQNIWYNHNLPIFKTNMERLIKQNPSLENDDYMNYLLNIFDSL